jgi:Sulfotransferase family
LTVRNRVGVLVSGGPSVLFVAGAGRSGSTLLGAMCGQIDGFTDVGELRHIWARGLLANELCGCGLPFRVCPFWTDVIERAFGSFDSAAPARHRALQRSVDRMWRIPQLRAARDGSRFAAQARAYAEAIRRLYSAVAATSGASVVVDSSKSPSHVFVANLARGLDLRVLHLVRDPRAVAFSWRRVRVRPEVAGGRQAMPRYPVAWAAFEWDVMNAAVRNTRTLGLPYAFLRYEDMVARPGPEVARTLSEIGLGSPELTFIRDDGVRLRPTHSVSGNPSRFAVGTVQLQPDLEWEGAMTRRDRLVVTALTWPLLGAYAYRPAVTAGGSRTGPKAR